jgi:hypothetical protein
MILNKSYNLLSRCCVGPQSFPKERSLLSPGLPNDSLLTIEINGWAIIDTARELHPAVKREHPNRLSVYAYEVIDFGSRLSQHVVPSRSAYPQRK